MGNTTIESNMTIKEKIAELRRLAVDPEARSILTGEGSLFEEHAVPIEEKIIPDVPENLKEIAHHVLTLSGLSAPETEMYTLTGAVQRLTVWANLNIILAHTGVLVFDLPPYELDAWQEFSKQNKVKNKEIIATGRLLENGSKIADKVLRCYAQSSARIGATYGKMGAPEIITLVGIHIWELSHMILDRLITHSLYHIAMHEAQDFFESSRNAANPPATEDFPSFIDLNT